MSKKNCSSFSTESAQSEFEEMSLFLATQTLGATASARSTCRCSGMFTDPGKGLNIDLFLAQFVFLQ